MAITRAQTQVTWSSASSITLSTNTQTSADAFALDDTCIGFFLTCSIDNSGTPSSGDTATFKIRWSTGDILGDSGNDFDTPEHAEYVATLDTVAANTPGEDPSRRTIIYGITPKNFILDVTWNSAAPGTRNGVARARVEEVRAA